MTCHPFDTWRAHEVILAAVAAALLFVGASSAADKVDAAKLVGKWELTKSADESAPRVPRSSSPRTIR